MNINGMDVLMIPRPGTGLAAATALIRRGSADELPGDHGLASFTISMLMRGTRRRSSERMAFDLESIGAMVGESDGLDACSLSMRSASSEAPAALQIMFEALREPSFDPQEHEIQRQELLAQLRMVEDEKFGFTYREYLKAMFAGHGYGHPSEGELENAQKITPEDCRRWHQDSVHAEAILFVAAGDFSVDDWRDMLGKLTEGWRAEARLRPRIVEQPVGPRQTEVNLSKPDLQQGFIVLGYPAPPVTHAGYPALRLASAALGEGFGGRIFTNLRDKKSLAYALGSTLRPYRLGGHQVLYIGTKPESIEEAHAGLLEEAEYIRQNLLTDEELHRAREFVIGRYLMGHQSLAQRVGHLAWWEDTGGDAALDLTYPQRLKAVTAGQIREAAQQWWQNPTTAILRPQER